MVETATEPVVRRRKSTQLARPTIPSSIPEVVALQAEMEELLRQMGDVKDALERSIAEAKTRAVTEAEALQAQVIERGRAIQAFANERRDELTRSGRTKTIATEDGRQLKWYQVRGRTIVKDGIRALLDIKKRGLLSLIKVRESIDLSALKRSEHARDIDGVEVTLGGEKFAIVLPGAGASVEQDLATKRWGISIKKKK